MVGVHFLLPSIEVILEKLDKSFACREGDRDGQEIVTVHGVVKRPIHYIKQKDFCRMICSWGRDVAY
jgi:hypothetical protein